jgi:hypothetical protein
MKLGQKPAKGFKLPQSPGVLFHLGKNGRNFKKVAQSLFSGRNLHPKIGFSIVPWGGWQSFPAEMTKSLCGQFRRFFMRWISHVRNTP